MTNNKIEIRQKINQSTKQKLQALKKITGYNEGQLIDLAIMNFKVTSKLKIIS